ncbi:DUF917 domain-containing protein [Curtobacterium sp. VKM Ac-2922]|uniref:DUF917 domain-containing protein n=1 Tax=Curtobacterium sp. VKM Ac-2922 TaxID=2929475 RepID=UPI001FB33F90|nr:DUF917 domain-containing protein [Curtobacterium sp. VKM Ac-2922]MCJ1712925.1 DUF917 domain-containing protein [Curtobacterium sp. VKM Ac-2922]
MHQGEQRDGAVTGLQADDAERLGRGAALLGCGGGGQVDHMVHALRIALGTDSVPVVPVDGGVRSVMAVGLVGSTTVLEEKVPSGRELPDALAAVERWTGRRADAVIAAQIGGVTAPAAALTAHAAGLPLVDADLVGRATPRIDQLSLFVDPLAAVTAAAVTSSGLRIVVDAPDPRDLETVWREAVSHSGGWAAFAIGPVDVDVLAERCVTGSVSRALDVGRAAARTTDVDHLGAAIGGRLVARGRVLDVQRGGDVLSFVHGSMALRDQDTGAVVRVEAGSEWVHCLVDGQPVASTPSCIVVVDARSLAPVTTDRARVGDELAVLVLPGAAWWWREPRRLARVGPRAFGIDADPVPEVAASPRPGAAASPLHGAAALSLPGAAA